MTAPASILLVEDSADDSFFFKRALTKAGVTVDLHMASDGVEAIQYLELCRDPAQERSWPKYIFLDLKMPNANGFEVLSWLKEKDFFPAQRVIVLTSSEEPTDLEQVRSFGVGLYLIKPISPDQLRHLLG